MNSQNLPHLAPESASKGRNISLNWSIVAALLIALGGTSCSNADKEKLPPVKVEEVKPAAKEVHDTLRVNLGDIGVVLYDNRRLSSMEFPGYTRDPSISGYTIVRDSASTYLARTPEYLGTDTPSNFPVVKLDGESARFLSRDLLLVQKGDKYTLHKTVGDSTLVWPVGTVESVVSIDPENASFAAPTLIGETTDAPSNKTVFLMKDGRKLFYTEGHIYPINNMSFEQIHKKKAPYSEGPEIPAKTLVLHTAQGKAVVEGWNELTYFDNIQYGDDSAVYFMKNQNIVNAEYPHAAELVEAIKSKKLYMNVPNPAYKDPVNQNNTLNGAVENKGNTDVPAMIEKNVSDQFANFKIKYIGIEYGEGETYFFSSDLKHFYYVDAEQDRETYQNTGKMRISLHEYPVSKIVGPHALPHEMQMSKLFTGDYSYYEGNAWKYLGEKNGVHQVSYKIKGAPGTYVQNGGEVKKILQDDRKTQINGYELKEFLYKNAKGTLVPLTDETPCPKDMQIILTFKK